MVDNGDNPPPGWAFPPSPLASLDPDIEIPASPSPGRTLTITPCEWVWVLDDNDTPDDPDDDYYDRVDDYGLYSNPCIFSAIESYGDSKIGSETEISTSRTRFNLYSKGYAGEGSTDLIEIKYRHIPRGTLIIKLSDVVNLAIPVPTPSINGNSNHGSGTLESR